MSLENNTCLFVPSVGIILGLLSNAKISSALDTCTNAVDAAIQDGTAYIDNTFDVCPTETRMSTNCKLSLNIGVVL